MRVGWVSLIWRSTQAPRRALRASCRRLPRTSAGRESPQLCRTGDYAHASHRTRPLRSGNGQAPWGAGGCGQHDPVSQFRCFKLDHWTNDTGQRRLFVRDVADVHQAGNTMQYETIILERKEGIGYLTLNRPDRANTISFQLMREVVSAVDEVEADPEYRVVILTGAGKHFCGEIGRAHV